MEVSATDRTEYPAPATRRGYSHWLRRNTRNSAVIRTAITTHNKILRNCIRLPPAGALGEGGAERQSEAFVAVAAQFGAPRSRGSLPLRCLVA